MERGWYPASVVMPRRIAGDVALQELPVRLAEGFRQGGCRAETVEDAAKARGRHGFVPWGDSLCSTISPNPVG
jgi:hypothetical protein